MTGDTAAMMSYYAMLERNDEVLIAHRSDGWHVCIFRGDSDRRWRCIDPNLPAAFCRAFDEYRKEGGGG